MTLARKPWKPGAYSTFRPRIARPRLTERTPVPSRVYGMVMNRAGGRCEVRVVRCRGQVRWHHRLMRQHDGPHTVVNGLAACDACHPWLHNHPKAAQEAGWLLRRGGDPAATPVRLHDGRRVYLTDDGAYREAAA